MELSAEEVSVVTLGGAVSLLQGTPSDWTEDQWDTLGRLQQMASYVVQEMVNNRSTVSRLEVAEQVANLLGGGDAEQMANEMKALSEDAPATGDQQAARAMAGLVVGSSIASMAAKESEAITAEVCERVRLGLNMTVAGVESLFADGHLEESALDDTSAEVRDRARTVWAVSVLEAG